MHLNECLQLVFSRTAADALEELRDNDNPPISDNSTESSSISSSSTQPQQTEQPQQNIIEGSIVSALQCIVAEWGTKAQTNFYIPREHHAGYTYLYEEKHQQSISNSHHTINHYTQHSHLIEHSHHPGFVYAEEFHNLHPHHYDVYTHAIMSNSTGGPQMTLTAMHSPINLTSLSSSAAFHHSPPSIFASLGGGATNIRNSAVPMPMTIPYMHPHLEMPVPPLQLPLFFGVLCFSYALGGFCMLCLPPKWAICGGGRNNESGEDVRHWFPYRLFGWILFLPQSLCSFIADYIHMTNISHWHTVDRFLACTLLALEVGKLIVMLPYTRPIIYSFNILAVCGAMVCFLNSQIAQQTLNEDGFVFWHSGWHCYPILAIGIRFAEVYMNQRWGEFWLPEWEVERSKGGGTLLRTITMNEHERNLDQWQPKNQSESNTNVKELDQIHVPTRAKKETQDGKTESSGTSTNGMASPLRRSRRIAKQKPDDFQPLR